MVPLDVFELTKPHIMINFLQDQWAINMIQDKDY